MENMGSQMKKSNDIIDSDQRKPILRRRSHTRRRVPLDSFVNMAEARREIVHALHLHRSSSSSSSSSSAPRTTSSSDTLLGNCYSTSTTSSSSQCYCYSLTESMPLPEPIWSTTEPSIPAAAPPPVAAAAAAMEGLEFEWGENQASSYSWWLGFLKALDSKNNNIVENYSKYPCLERIHLMGNSRASDLDQDSCKLGVGDQGPNLDDASHDQQNSSPDEWLMFPTTDDHQNEIPNPS